MTDPISAADAAQVRRMTPRIRRLLGDWPEGMGRAALRRRLSSREKHLYDAALELLIAVGDVVAVPYPAGGTRYVLAPHDRNTHQGRLSPLKTTT